MFTQISPYNIISFTITLTDSRPFHTFRSSSATRETISHGENFGFFTSPASHHHHATSFILGFDASRISRCFHSFPRGFTSRMVSSWMRKSGLRLPIPNGRKLSMISRLSSVKSVFGFRIHSISRTLFGRFSTS